MDRSSVYPAAFPHEPIEEIFPDIFMVHGSIQPGPGMKMNRNMVVLRHGGELTVIGAVRLNAGAQAKLDSLGKVMHVMRIGYYHGLDDRYYVERYGAEFWCQPGSDRYREPKPTRLIAEGTTMPLPGAELFIFRQTKSPEAAILVKRHGGLLITSDCLQHWSDWSYCTWLAKLVMRAFGFSLRTLIGTFWLRYMTRRGESLKPDFERLLRLEFKHHIAAHGRLCRDTAHQQAEAEIRRVFA
jgi:hypothetical protein